MVFMRWLGSEAGELEVGFCEVITLKATQVSTKVVKFSLKREKKFLQYFLKSHNILNR